MLRAYTENETKLNTRSDSTIDAAIKSKPEWIELSSEGRSSGSREEAKFHVEEQLITCKYNRMINRYFLSLTEMRL